MQLPFSAGRPVERPGWRESATVWLLLRQLETSDICLYSLNVQAGQNEWSLDMSTPQVRVLLLLDHRVRSRPFGNRKFEAATCCT